MTVSKQLVEVDNRLIEKHSGNSWSVLLAQDCKDVSIDVVSDEVVSFFTLKGIEWANINLGQLNNLHLRLCLLLLNLSWILLTHWVLSLALRGALISHYFVIAILLLLRHLLLLMMWVLRLIMLVLILVVTSSALTSSASTIATSTSVVKFVSSIAISHHWILTARVPLHLLRSMEIVVTLVLISYEVDNVENLLLSSLLMLVFHIVLGLPEVHSKWSHAISKAAGLIEVLDAFLCVLNVLIEYITNLIIGERFSIDVLLMGLEFDGGDFTSL